MILAIGNLLLQQNNPHPIVYIAEYPHNMRIEKHFKGNEIIYCTHCAEEGQIVLSLASILVMLEFVPSNYYLLIISSQQQLMKSTFKTAMFSFNIFDVEQ